MKTKSLTLILAALLAVSSPAFSSVSSEYAHESDEYVGYYHFDKHTPRKGCAIYFSWNGNSLIREKLGVLQNNYLLMSNDSPKKDINDLSAYRHYKIPMNQNFKRWRYLRAQYLEFEKPPFDEFVVYHLTEKNPPTEGQLCIFYISNQPQGIFGWNPITQEHFGQYVNGSFYKLDAFETFTDWKYIGSDISQSLQWPIDQKAPGLPSFIYWREVAQLP